MVKTCECLGKLRCSICVHHIIFSVTNIRMVQSHLKFWRKLLHMLQTSPHLASLATHTRAGGLQSNISFCLNDSVGTD